MKQIIKRIKHFFIGHIEYVEYDDKYLFCDCGFKIEHKNNKVIKDWVFPFINNK